jgi:inosose dehydratase
MNEIRIANAPCSWGALEFEGLAGEAIGYRQMLDELRETGYTGTELGDWGFMPTEPAALRAELEQRGLAMVGAFVPVALKHAEAHADGAVAAVKVARLLAAVAERAGTPPLIVLADANGADPARTNNAGRVTPDLGLSAAEWRTFAQGAEAVAGAVRAATGLATAFHHHCAGYVETPDEIARLLELTDPELLGLVFDTGHFLFGAAGAQGQTIQAALDRFGERIWHMHFKDCHPRIAAQSRAEGWDYFEAVRRGVFCELGQGAADFQAAAAWLRARDYRGWIVVEQDVLPGMGAPKQSAARNRAYLRTIGL